VHGRIDGPEDRAAIEEAGISQEELISLDSCKFGWKSGNLRCMKRRK